MKRSLFSRANLYLFSVIVGIFLILFVIYTLVTSNNTVADQDWKNYLLLVIWIIFTIATIFFYKRELKNQKVKKQPKNRIKNVLFIISIQYSIATKWFSGVNLKSMIFIHMSQYRSYFIVIDENFGLVNALSQERISHCPILQQVNGSVQNALQFKL